jgi:hypothetical protein
MFVPSRGRGFLVAIVTVASLSLTDLLTSLHYHDKNYYAQHGWPKLTAFWVAAGIVQLMLPGRNEEVAGYAPQMEDNPAILRDRDSLLLIPVKYWPTVLFVLGIGFYFVRD